MGNYDDVLGLAFVNRFLQEAETMLILFVESGRIKLFHACHDAVEVGNGVFCHVSVLNWYFRP